MASIKQQADHHQDHHQDWQFWIDRGGTFTDIIGKSPQGMIKVIKMLSENPQYQDAAIAGIARLLGVAETEISERTLGPIKMGTTVATNALLESQGAPTLLVITQGFADLLYIGDQHRPELFQLNIQRPPLLYSGVIEAHERIHADGKVLVPLAEDDLQQQLRSYFQQGYRSCAIVFMHSFMYPQHEERAASIAAQVGFQQISISSQVSPLMKIVPRGNTCVMDAYLTPVLRHYVEQFTAKLASNQPLQFMQSNGGLTSAQGFSGKDAILSGPAGGVVAMVETAKQAGFAAIVGLDMGGTSSDVALYEGDYDRTFNTQVMGIPIQAPMMAIHTVAAGGGSILGYDGQGAGLRLTVGPESAGAQPGPAAYGFQGPLTVTDLNVLLGRLQPDHFPAIFGPSYDQRLDLSYVQQEFAKLKQQIHSPQSLEQLALGYLQIAVEHMANAIKHISVQRGVDIARFTLCCFGGAGAQHACLVADALGIHTIYIHRLSSVLSAYGMGLADVRVLKVQAIEQILDADHLEQVNQVVALLTEQATDELQQQGFTPQQIEIKVRCDLKYQGTDSNLSIDLAHLPLSGLSRLSRLTQQDIEPIVAQFTQLYRQRYGFYQGDDQQDITNLVIEAIQVEGKGKQEAIANHQISIIQGEDVNPVESATPLMRPVYFQNQGKGSWIDTPFYLSQSLMSGSAIIGPAVIVAPHTTIVVEPHWRLTVSEDGDLILQPKTADTLATTAPCLHTNQLDALSQGDFAPHSAQHTSEYGTGVDPCQDLAPDPARLELFNHLFRFIAEQMGFVLQNTATSVNIKERLDFSCALFNHRGELVANAPHMPVHLGSMGESVSSIAQQNRNTMRPGDVYLINSPYHGGSHLPDLTVVTPVFSETDPSTQSPRLEYFVASRGHHADIGGISPGSMPAQSVHIEQEGILFSNFLLVRADEFQQQSLVEHLSQHRYPARNIRQNIADLQAQIAANQQGVRLLRKVEGQYGKEQVAAYMAHMLDAAASSVQQAISQLQSGRYTVNMDDNKQVSVTVHIKDQQAIVDFSGSSEQQPHNFNTPYAVVKAAVLYVFRTLVTKDIPLNAGCLRPIEIHVPYGSMLNPQPPAAVVAGNVETSQAITDALYAALGISAAAQGTMNNFSFGDKQLQYYETICGGTGAGVYGDGCDAVQSHMTNSRITDPEVLEWRFPVTLLSFAIRHGSGGYGHYRGGNGVTRSIRFERPMQVSILANRRQFVPFGLAGGMPGEKGQTMVRYANGDTQVLASCATLDVQQGDTLIINTPGGGGFKSPNKDTEQDG